MQIQQLVILLAMMGYAIFRQTRRHEVIGDRRFKLAATYGIIGLAVGGYHLPDGPYQVGFLVVSITLGILVGLLRGQYSTFWPERGRVYSQGTPFTITLFLLLIAAKVALGTVAYVMNVSDDGGFGEILLMIALMMAFEAEIIWRRTLLDAHVHESDPISGTESPLTNARVPR